MSVTDPIVHDIVLIGGGGAGLRAAIAGVEEDPKLTIAVVSKVYPMSSHTVSAEGGSAGVVRTDNGDSLDLHAYDTIKGSDFIADQDIVEVFVREAPGVCPRSGWPGVRVAGVRLLDHVHGERTEGVHAERVVLFEIQTCGHEKPLAGDVQRDTAAFRRGLAPAGSGIIAPRARGCIFGASRRARGGNLWPAVPRRRRRQAGVTSSGAGAIPRSFPFRMITRRIRMG